MAKDEVTADVNGLQLSNNTFSSSPPGSMLRAEEVVMPQKGVAEPRRGQDRAAVLTSNDEIPFAVTEFQGETIVSGAPGKTSENYILGVAANPTTDFTGGPWNPVDDDGSSTSYGRMKFGFAGSYMYFCTTTGPKCLESTAGTPRAGGLEPMPDMSAGPDVPSGLGANGVGLAYGYSRAYRSLWILPTSDGAKLLSAPSGAFVARNELLAQVGDMVRTGGTTVTVTFTGVITPGLAPGDSFDLTPGEANFVPGTYTVATVGAPNPNNITYLDAGPNVSNTAEQSFDTGPRPVLCDVPLPVSATTDTPIRIYRSLDTTTTEPSDELYLVAEVFPDSTDISNGYIQFLDITPAAVLDDPLYTNPLTGEGALQANYPPPLYRDLDFWGSRMWYAQTTALQQFELQMLGVGGPDGVQDGDTLTIDVPGAAGTPYVFTFKNSPGVGEVLIVDYGLPSFNIGRTTAALSGTIQSVLAADGVQISTHILGGQVGGTGRLLIQAVSQAQGPFTVAVSRPSSWTPAFVADEPEDSTGEYIPNGLFYSKLDQPEAVPLVNFTTVGSKNYAIARVLGLKEALLVFKTGDGIYALTGSAPFQVRQISVANIIAPDACVKFADSAWVYTDQGILRISDSGGSTVVSRPIETELNRLRALFLDETYDYSFAVAYETERRVMFFVPFDIDEDSGLPVLRAWCYNNATQAWTGPLYTDAFSGIVSPTQDKLVLGMFDESTDVGRITLERKGNNPAYLDFADADFAGSISAVDVGGDPLVITLASASNVEAGDGIVQGSWRAKVASVDGNNVTLYDEVPFTAAACAIYKHYDVTVQFQPNGNPASRKTLTRLAWLFKPEWFANYAGNTIIATDQIQADNEISTPSTGFGLSPFGAGPFGNPTPLVVDVNPLDATWTNAAQFLPGFKLSEVWPKFKLQGFMMMLATADAPAGRGR